MDRTQVSGKEATLQCLLSFVSHIAIRGKMEGSSTLGFSLIGTNTKATLDPWVKNLTYVFKYIKQPLIILLKEKYCKPVYNIVSEYPLTKYKN